MEFLNGNKFNKFFRSDGRKYKGYWKNGKQNGEGEFYQVKEGVWKKGIWSEGKRVRWTNNEAAFANDTS
jgi:hypothetical protein